VSCTKAQLLALLMKLKRERCNTVECYIKVINTYILLVEEKAVDE
jgi:hypothetical protein